VNYELSLNLSRNGKIESKIKMECAFTKDAKSYIKVYRFRMQRDSIEIKKKLNYKKIETKWKSKEGFKGGLGPPGLSLIRHNSTRF
jgi:hypothetical protein